MAHKTRIRVRFYELDPYNHVNHAVYIQYFETARIELLREAGLSLPEMMQDGLMIVVSEIHTKFLGSAEDGDELTIESEILEVKRVTARWRQRMVRDGAVIATQELRAAVVSADGRPARFPQSMIDALEPYAAPDD